MDDVSVECFSGGGVWHGTSPDRSNLPCSASGLQFSILIGILHYVLISFAHSNHHTVNPMRVLVSTLLFFFVAFSSAPPHVATEFTAKVIGVTDGDTLNVLRNRQQITIRLEGIDAPEKNQAFGSKAKSALSTLVFGKTVNVRTTGTDKYGRTLARIRVESYDVSELLVKKGMAWHFKEYSKDESLSKLEHSAKKYRLGLWSESNALPPWEFRDRQRGNSIQRKSTESKRQTRPIVAAESRYWLNAKSGVRHNATCQYYKNTKEGHLCGPNDGKACGNCGG